MNKKLSVSMMIYPADFKEQLSGMAERCAGQVLFFNQDFVFCIVHVHHEDGEADALWGSFLQHMTAQDRSVMVFAEDECAAVFQQMELAGAVLVSSRLWQGGGVSVALARRGRRASVRVCGVWVGLC